MFINADRTVELNYVINSVYAIKKHKICLIKSCHNSISHE